MSSSEGSVPVGFCEEDLGGWVASPEVNDVMEEPGEAPTEHDGVDFIHSDSVVEGFFGSIFERLVVG